MNSPLSSVVTDPLAQYGCGPIQFSCADNTFYERCLLFDQVIDPETATRRDQFEVFALAVRDVHSQRWVLTERTYQQRNPQRIYYLSMEYLLGRSLSNNVMNLLLESVAEQTVVRKQVRVGCNTGTGSPEAMSLVGRKSE
jgi:starch phosphorylase